MDKITQLSAQNILPKLALDRAKWNRIPSEDDIAQTVKSIEARGGTGYTGSKWYSSFVQDKRADPSWFRGDEWLFHYIN